MVDRLLLSPVFCQLLITRVCSQQSTCLSLHSVQSVSVSFCEAVSGAHVSYTWGPLHKTRIRNQAGISWLSWLNLSVIQLHKSGIGGQ